MVPESIPSDSSRARRSRTTSRAGVRACAAFFEDHHCVFQEVDQQNDFGKDAYVDLLHTQASVGHCVALQIKSGPSYRQERGYVIPIEKHASTWRESTVPVFGIVFDPGIHRLCWVDLTGYLRANPQVQSGNVVVPDDNVLDDSHFSAFCRAVADYRPLPSNTLYLDLLSDSEPRQAQAVLDAWALCRRDARYLLLLRRLILEFSGPVVPFLIQRLSLAAGHPDVFYTAQTWLPPPIQARARASFRWSPAEVAHMARAIHHEDWGRGSLGQCLDVLLVDDPNTLVNASDALGLLLATGDLEQAIRLLILGLSYSDDPRAYLDTLCARYPPLMGHWIITELNEQLRENNHVSLY